MCCLNILGYVAFPDSTFSSSQQLPIFLCLGMRFYAHLPSPWWDLVCLGLEVVLWILSQLLRVFVKLSCCALKILLLYLFIASDSHSLFMPTSSIISESWEESVINKIHLVLDIPKHLFSLPWLVGDSVLIIIHSK